MFERLLRDLNIVLTRPMTLEREGIDSLLFEERRFMADCEGTAEDLADIIVHGRINEAVNAYAVVRKDKPDFLSSYISHRKRFFALSPTHGDSGREE